MNRIFKQKKNALNAVSKKQSEALRKLFFFSKEKRQMGRLKLTVNQEPLK